MMMMMITRRTSLLATVEWCLMWQKKRRICLQAAARVHTDNSWSSRASCGIKKFRLNRLQKNACFRRLLKLLAAKRRLVTLIEDTARYEKVSKC